MTMDTTKTINTSSALATAGAEGAPLWRRLLWMAGIWVASTSVLGVVAYAIRLVLKP